MGLNVKLFPIRFIFLLLVVVFSSMAQADVYFENWKREFRQEALTQGILPSVYQQAFASIKPDPDIIVFDGNQPEFTRHIWDYLNNAISEARIKKGKALLQTYRLLFDKIEERYGVQRELITAIWAMESDFGRNYGSRSVIRSLATLAYASNSKKRAKFARSELILALKVMQIYKFKTTDLVGSWAGAMGQAQFMPSSFLKYAVDYNNDGKIDLWDSIPDVLGSIANFLAESGWRKFENWGEEIVLPTQFDWRLNTSAYELRFEQWQENNVKRADGLPFKQPQRQAALFIPAGKSGPTFLVTHNFEVIKRYNKSSSYALAVAHLSDLFSTGKNFQTPWPTEEVALSHKQITEIQMQLNLAGHNAGFADGKVGSKTREAIRTWQLEQGFAGDGYANLELLKQLKTLKTEE